MAAGPPLSQLALVASSVADDLGYVALSDLSDALASATSSYRIIGGHMVTVLAARWNLGADLYRETADTDLGVPPLAIRDDHLLQRLRDVGYQKIEGNRFARTLTDLPVVAPRRAADEGHQAIVDVLVPAYTSRARQNRAIGDELVTTEVLGLATALKRDAVTMRLKLQRLNGVVLRADLSFPDEVAALVLKAFATRVRNKPTDVVDVWRCLEVAVASGMQPSAFDDVHSADAAAIVRALFARRDGQGMRALIAEQRLSSAAADARFTRLRALIDRVLGAG